jgi:hypothetical protein
VGGAGFFFVAACCSCEPSNILRSRLSLLCVYVCVLHLCCTHVVQEDGVGAAA